MTRWIFALVTAAAMLLPIGTLRAQAPDADGEAEASDTSTKPAPVPPDVFKAIREAQRPPSEDASRQTQITHYTDASEKILAIGTKAERDYPDAPNLHAVRGAMLEAAGMLMRLEGTRESRRQFVRIARSLAETPTAPPQLRYQADENATAIDIFLRATTTRPADARTHARKHIEAFVARHADGEFAGNAVLTSAMLAKRLDLSDTLDGLLDTIEAKHADMPNAERFLRIAGRLPFEAELTTLDGETIALPDDMKGKVVLIDFWATWCAPCIRAMPHMRELYEKYHPKGVEFIGISLDRRKSDLTSWLEENDLPWAVTFSDKGGQDPTAQQYGVSSIPSVWVIGADGKVVADSLRANIADALDRALAADAE
ncbi:MAG: TlpA family protein disulfide reductase [Phycisphaerae bacterium]|nr:TlpA family protein disulfide reductase [Phycisphaerae bacterium]